MTVRFYSVPPQFRGRKPGEGGAVASHFSFPSTNVTRGLAARRLFKVPPCRKCSIHLQTSMSSPGFEPSSYGTAASVANHYTGCATSTAVGSLVVRASDSRPEGLGSMLDVTKYPPSAHGFTCRNCGGGDRGRVAIYRPFGEVSLSLNRTVTCMVLKANDRRTSCPCHDEFRGPRSDYCQTGGISHNNNNIIF
ncbi:uncharacterized protein TNCV_1220411 [Trichonephila clavipes]|nr:uncharacterized protein TNCV_1220411 [Trichonephila clavipes]